MAGIERSFKSRVIQHSLAGTIDVFTDPQASPTGFPFKVVQLEGTISEPKIHSSRSRVCDLGYLRQAYRKADGTVGYRCPAEPKDTYVAKGGALDDTVGRKCVCNGLVSTIGLGQIRPGDGLEPALLTAGDDVSKLRRFLPSNRTEYTAADVISYLLAGHHSPSAPAASP